MVKHGEHIIQQAIGGTLIANDVLCEECGKTLGDEIDVPFNKIFDSICIRLDIRTHRGNNRSKPAKGVIHSTKDQYGNNLSGIEILWRDGKVAPVKPFHIHISESNKIIVYGEKKQLVNYLKKVRLDIEKTFPADSKPDLITCDDITGLIIYPLEIVNEHFVKGMAKIAIGFAARAGVDRRYFDLALDINSNKIKDKCPLVQFYPLGAFDKIVEKHKSEIRYFPAHTLILFTSPSNSNILICYIELLSTFQWYVILSNSYDGPPIYQGYTQRVDKVEDYVFEPGRRYYKEREMILSSLNITQKEIEKAYERQKDHPGSKTTHDIEIEIVEKKHNEQKYKVSFDEEVKSAIDFALSKCTDKFTSDSTCLNDVSDIMGNMRLFYNVHNDEEIFNSSTYRRVYYHNEKKYDSVESIIRFYETDAGRKAKKEYGHEKVYDLCDYIQKKNINDKFKT
ncbi:hypothetical protein GTP58_13265 [Duganella sp. CY15W]|nr:hypothetical protein [Duganella sp. CY15W]